MIDFPSTTKVFANIPKESFYKNLSITKSLKEKFISDIEKINVENSLTNENLRFEKEGKIQEILLVSILLKKNDFDNKIIEFIARKNSHKLVFLIEFDNYQKLAIFHNKLYQTSWCEKEEISLKLKGFSLDEVWENFVKEIAFRDNKIIEDDSYSLDNLIEIKEEKEKLEKLITKTTNALRKELQPKKQYELHKKLKEYEKKLNELLELIKD
ncbi:MAG: DUF4391 domain-containing protein [Bdellovibrionota bacterium]|nr:DUF4391 domain-containing protein [Pseudomonadota bacterium]MDY6090645.1 DUF4391 domain-containing protein [Bdellovibrionota bacterium]